MQLWQVAPSKRNVEHPKVHDSFQCPTPPITADGRKAVVGTMKGKCRFYTIEKSALEYEAQLGEASLRL